MQSNKNIDEWINWIEEAINKNYIKYYKYESFKNIKEIGSGVFRKVFCANWKSSNKYLALRSFFNFNSITLKEIVNEVIFIILKELGFIIFFFKKKYYIFVYSFYLFISLF
jgi:hypothetical protein